MKSIQRLVIALLLGIWCFPAVSFAAPLQTASAVVGSRASSGAAQAQPATQTEGVALDAREKESRELQNFQGGAAYVYIGGGAVTFLLLVILILILV